MGASGAAGAPSPAAAPVPVLFVHTGVDWIRGSERCLLDLVAGLDRRRFRPLLWCDTPTLAAAARDLGAEIEPADDRWARAAESLRPHAGLVERAREIVRRHGVRLVHANNPIPLKWMLPAARAARIPTLVHMHLQTTADERVFNGVHQAALVVGVSRSAVAGLVEDGMPPSRIRVIYNGVDPTRLGAGDATGLRASLGVAPDEIVIGSVGTLIPIKGVDVLIRAFAQLRVRAPRTRLLLVGGGRERDALAALAASLGVGDAVHFLGERPDAGPIARDAVDVAASASRYEAFPLALLEAALFGRAVVASAIPAHRESVVEGETGLLAAPDDPAAFADALGALVADPALRRRMGEAGRARVEREFLVGHYVANFARAYEELLARRASAYGWLRGSTFPPVYRRWIGGALRRRLRRPRGGAA